MKAVEQFERQRDKFDRRKINNSSISGKKMSGKQTPQQLLFHDYPNRTPYVKMTGRTVDDYVTKPFNRNYVGRILQWAGLIQDRFWTPVQWRGILPKLTIPFISSLLLWKKYSFIRLLDFLIVYGKREEDLISPIYRKWVEYIAIETCGHELTESESIRYFYEYYLPVFLQLPETDQERLGNERQQFWPIFYIDEVIRALFLSPCPTTEFYKSLKHLQHFDCEILDSYMRNLVPMEAIERHPKNLYVHREFKKENIDILLEKPLIYLPSRKK